MQYQRNFFHAIQTLCSINKTKKLEWAFLFMEWFWFGLVLLLWLFIQRLNRDEGPPMMSSQSGFEVNLYNNLRLLHNVNTTGEIIIFKNNLNWLAFEKKEVLRAKSEYVWESMTNIPHWKLNILVQMFFPVLQGCHLTYVSDIPPCL